MSATSGMGGGKSVNVELNLVPFIDLFSTLICFLLLTAAYNELESLSSNSPPKATAEIPENSPMPPPDDKKKVMFTVAIGIAKMDMAEDDKITAIPFVNGELDTEKMKAILMDWKTRFPDRKDVILATDNKSKYKHLVATMDLLIAEKFPDVGINLN